MKKAEAIWGAELWVECPYCEDYQKVIFLEIDEWWSYFPLCKSKSDINYKYECEECKKEFIIDETCW